MYSKCFDALLAQSSLWLNRMLHAGICVVLTDGKVGRARSICSPKTGIIPSYMYVYTAYICYRCGNRLLYIYIYTLYLYIYIFIYQMDNEWWIAIQGN